MFFWWWFLLMNVGNCSVHLEHTGMAGKTLDLNEVASAADDRIHREPPCWFLQGLRHLWENCWFVSRSIFQSLRELGGLMEAGQTDWRQIRLVWRGPEPVGGKEPHIAHPRDWQHQRSTLRRTELTGGWVSWLKGWFAALWVQNGSKFAPESSESMWIYWFVFIFPLFYGHQL